ncbi:p53-induced death domain-containing protein 1-like [Patiria miniata]|uniref:Death domain-containing protein n=1 Tax=Patiria miniata TaxID=46514 RepID=A0A914B1B5_PATMI|nr:p53-induced death domain-containing protein 1-like [Patiria miniata]
MAAPGEFGVPRVLNSKNRLTLSQNIGDKWEALAIVLDFSDAKIETFRANNQQNQEGQIRTMLTEWVQKNAGKPLVQMLVEAFRASTVNLKTLALAVKAADENGGDIVL